MSIRDEEVNVIFRVLRSTDFSFQVYVTKRPHVDEFLRRVGELYECVLFTASLAKVTIVDVTLRP